MSLMTSPYTVQMMNLTQNQFHQHFSKSVSVNLTDEPAQNSRLRLCLLFNARSIYKKKNNLRTMLSQIETWERKKQSLYDLISL